MVLSETTRKAIEAILTKGERVELVPVKDGVKVYAVKRREAVRDTMGPGVRETRPGSGAGNQDEE